ncbi:hypothetical protein BZB76_1679 [Actinomadura pelletieri DSM 43383]|uniref:Uncharacterized protein n=1 Tax=Actinomadura pelletieri DSM 43383 TaxID=1120940 RepID=A0A495QS46_9ACTN|nr:hypothetical protein [Actinomadura pelletieri]RKS76325.1 hypothetical protein BZB76_1679 [Actinomadura pelletieri DSM 43383]
MSRPLKVLVGVLVATAALPSTSALATDAYAAQGGRVLAQGWAPAGGKAGMAGVRDTYKKNWVKNEYNRAGTGKRKYTLWNKRGKGKTTYTKNGRKVTKIHVCEDRDKAPDICSKWTPVK